jgi:ribonuclease HI
MTPRVTIYTDGGCDPNPGPGGYGAVILDEGKPPRELCGGDPETTNNRMEMTAAIEALRTLDQPSEIHLWTDSQYLKNGVTKWMKGWRANGWMTKAKEPVKNQDLWEALDVELARHKVHWHWTKGHAGDHWNEVADQLATRGTMIGRSGRKTNLMPASEAPELPKAVGSGDDSPAKRPAADPNTLRIYLGVSFSGKDQVGAIAALLRIRDIERTITKIYSGENSNRLHLHSAIEALDAIKRPLPLQIFTNSDYLRDGVTKWIKSWRAHGWKTKAGDAVMNRDLWEKVDALCARHEIEWFVAGKDGEAPPELAMMKQVATDTRTIPEG